MSVNTASEAINAVEQELNGASVSSSNEGVKKLLKQKKSKKVKDAQKEKKDKKKGKKGKKEKKPKRTVAGSDEEADEAVDEAVDESIDTRDKIQRLIRDNKSSADDLFKQACSLYEYHVIQENVEIEVSKLKTHRAIRPVEKEDVKTLVDALKTDTSATIAEFKRSKILVMKGDDGMFLIGDGNHRVSAIKAFNADAETKIETIEVGYVLEEVPDFVPLCYLTKILEKDAKKHKTTMKKRDLAKNTRKLLAACPISGESETAKDEEVVRLITELYMPEESPLPFIRRFSMISESDFTYMYRNWNKFNEGSKFWNPVLTNYVFKPKAVMKLLQCFGDTITKNEELNQLIQESPREVVAMLKYYGAWDNEINESDNLWYFNQRKGEDMFQSLDKLEEKMSSWLLVTRSFSNLHRKGECVTTRREYLRNSFQSWAKSNEDAEEEESTKSKKVKAKKCLLGKRCSLCHYQSVDPTAKFLESGNEAAAALYVYATAVAGQFSCPSLLTTYSFMFKYLVGKSFDTTCLTQVLEPTNGDSNESLWEEALNNAEGSIPANSDDEDDSDDEENEEARKPEVEDADSLVSETEQEVAPATMTMKTVRTDPVPVVDNVPAEPLCVTHADEPSLLPGQTEKVAAVRADDDESSSGSWKMPDVEPFVLNLSEDESDDDSGDKTFGPVTEGEARGSDAQEEAEKLVSEEEAEKLVPEEEAEKLVSEEEAEKLVSEEEARKLVSDEEAEKLVSEEEARKIVSEDEARSSDADQEARKSANEEEERPTEIMIAKCVEEGDRSAAEPLRATHAGRGHHSKNSEVNRKRKSSHAETVENDENCAPSKSPRYNSLFDF